MRYWWVNQNQTYKQETEGGYLWSPKLRVDGSTHPFYEFMKEVSCGDLVYSFQGTYIRAIGEIMGPAFSSPKPQEFGNIGAQWNELGWRVNVHFNLLKNQIKPSNHIQKLKPTLPKKYSPLQKNGRGNQAVYLTHINREMANVLNNLIGEEVRNLIDSKKVGESPESYDLDINCNTPSDVSEWEEKIIQKIIEDDNYITEKLTLIMARRGQGKFKKSVMKYENCCRITKVNNIEYLIASHIKPWRECENNFERLDGANGLLLTPSIDLLFD